MEKEDYLRGLMIAKSGSVKAFAREAGLPYTTITSLFDRNRGLDTVTIKTLDKISKVLGFTTEEIRSGSIFPGYVPPKEEPYLRVKEIAEEKGLDYIGVSQLCGIPAPTLLDMFTNKPTNVSVDYLIKLAKGLNVTTDQLVGLEERQLDEDSARPVDKAIYHLQQALRAYSVTDVAFSQSNIEMWMRVIPIIMHEISKDK